MKDKFEMSQELNIEMAKRMLVDAIYKSANLEGIAVTFAQTIDVLNNVSVSLTPNEVGKICSLRDAWHYTLDNINTGMDLGFLENLHTYVARADLPYSQWGVIRTDEVMISGTFWRPEIPNIEKLHRELMDIMTIPCVTDRALTVMLWAMRNQIFRDGNKRVATIAANKILIEGGRGLISIPVELDSKFKQMLVEFYENNDSGEIKNFLYENCLDGVNRVKEITAGNDGFCR